jgi:DsbC/DsbD-like thiol-disulfide interchange protein
MACAAKAQTGDILGRSTKLAAEKQAVLYLFPEQVTVPAGKSTTLALHFRVIPGLHINSHTPKDEFLIPTNLTIPDGKGVKLEAASYPPGAEMTLPVDPGTKLSVYFGEFTVQAKVRAEAGDHLVEAKLRYQACDNSACLPPQTIPVTIDVLGKE